MTWILSYPTLVLAYVFLFLSVALLWFPGRRKVPNWGIALIIALVFGLWSKQVAISSLFFIILFAYAVYYSQVKMVNEALRLLTNAAVLFLATGFAIHQMPGFDAWAVLDHVFINADALPYNLYFSFDKVMIGIFILGLGFPLITSKKETLRVVNMTWPIALALIVLLMLLTLILGYVRFEPKLPGSIFIWALSNLLFTCVAEEALFRGFIQKKLVQFFSSKWPAGIYIGIAVSSLLFGMAHYGGGHKYIFLATVAGLGYGWAYQVTGRIEAAIMTHFSVNLVHFLFFTYPALASAF